MRLIEPSHNSQPSNDSAIITGLVLPPIDDSFMFDLLILAIRREKPLEFIKSLIEQGGINVDAVPDDGWDSGEYVKRLLHYAAESSTLDVVQYLISEGANVNARTENGRNPLHYAAENTLVSVDVLECLISHGADVHAKDRDGKTPLDCAYQEEKKHILRAAMTQQPNQP